MKSKSIRVYQSIIHKHRAIAVKGQYLWHMDIGKAGIVHRKKEGDLATPKGKFRILFGYNRADKRAQFRSPFIRHRVIRKTDGWCDDPSSMHYNRPVKLPSQLSHELLWRDDGQYDRVYVLDYNICPAMRGRGSAIFLHIRSHSREGSAGCLTLESQQLDRFLRTFVRPCQKIRVM